MAEAGTPEFPKMRPPVRPFRARLAFVVAACAAVVLVGASIVNRSRFSLRCEDGQLLVYRGLSLPVGSGRWDPETYPAVDVPPTLCEDVTVSSRLELEQRYLESTMQRIDTAIRSDDEEQLAEAAEVVEQLVGSGKSAVLDNRKRALIVALLRADLRGAEAALERARDRLIEAEAAGVAPEVIKALRAELASLSGGEGSVSVPAPVPKTPETSITAEGRAL